MNPHYRRSPVAVSGSADWCHICGLHIPAEIFSEGHPLFGTVDHVKPKALGGTNAIENRRAAHRLCNRTKGNGGLSVVDRFALQGAIKYWLERTCRMTVTKRMMTVARERVNMAVIDSWSTKSPARPLSIQVWDNEGGAVGPRKRRHDESDACDNIAP